MVRRVKAVLGIVAVLGFAALYYLVNPIGSAWMPKCSFKMMTRLDCPGCGSQRMLHALLHGDFAGAWHANAFIICMIPVLILLIFSAMTRTRYPRLYAVVNSIPSMIGIMAAIVIWTVLRNIL